MKKKGRPKEGRKKKAKLNAQYSCHGGGVGGGNTKFISD